MRNRIAAGFGAVALVVVAVVVRGAISGDDGGATGGGGDGGGGERPVVACSPGVEAVCEALADAGLVAADPPTFDLGSDASVTGVVDDEREVDAWVTWNPAGDIANFDAGKRRGSPTWDSPVPVGSSPLAIGATEVPAPCDPAEVTWACLTQSAADDGTTIAVGNPARIDGLVRVTPFVAVARGPEDSIRDVDLSHIDRVVENPTADSSTFVADLRTFLTAHGSFQVVVGPADGLERDLESRPTEVHAPSGAGAETAMNLVVVPRVGASTGWVDAAFGRSEVAEAVRDVGVDPAATTLDGSPDPGDLYALRERLTG